MHFFERPIHTPAPPLVLTRTVLAHNRFYADTTVRRQPVGGNNNKH